MPWRPRYTRSEAEAAIQGSASWAQVLDSLGYVYHGKNIRTLKKWAERWGISTDHLPINAIRRYSYTEADARAAIAESKSLDRGAAETRLLLHGWERTNPEEARS